MLLPWRLVPCIRAYIYVRSQRETGSGSGWSCGDEVYQCKLRTAAFTQVRPE